MDYQPLNTYIVEYSYPDYHFESEIGVFCDSDPCGTPPSKKTLKAFFDDGGEPDIVEIIGTCENTFSETEVLSRGETGACWDSMGVIKQCQDLHFRAGRQD